MIALGLGLASLKLAMLWEESGWRRLAWTPPPRANFAVDLSEPISRQLRQSIASRAVAQRRPPGDGDLAAYG